MDIYFEGTSINEQSRSSSSNKYKSLSTMRSNQYTPIDHSYGLPKISLDTQLKE